jgi:hypothetical protein
MQPKQNQDKLFCSLTKHATIILDVTVHIAYVESSII